MVKLLHVWLAALLLALTAPVPVFAADTPAAPAAHSGCFSHYAQWPVDGDDPLPPGTWTRVHTCMVGGHQVRINSAAWPIETYHCGAMGETSEVSVRVDGVKVVDGQTGLGSLCFEQDTRLVTKVIVNDSLHLTVCHLDGQSQRDTPYAATELKPGQHDIAVDDGMSEDRVHFVEDCTLTTLNLPAGATDAYFSRRTPPGLDLAAGGDAMCPYIQAAFAEPVNGRALGPAPPSALDADKTDTVTLTGQPFDAASDADKAPGRITRYTLDIDHDGVADTLVFTEKAGEDDMAYPGQYSWTSGASGKTYNITGTMLGTGVAWTSDLYPDPVRDELTFVAADDKVWLYRASVGLVGSFPTSGAEEVERMMGAVDEGTTPSGTRWVYELRPDGTARVACQWTARKRPEEFL